MGIAQRVQQQTALHAEVVIAVIGLIPLTLLTPHILHQQTAMVAVAAGNLDTLELVGVNRVLQFFTHLLKFEP